MSVGFLGGRGRGSLEILGVDSIRSHPSYHFRMRLKGGVFFAHVDDRMESWMDVLSLASLRFEQDQKEVNYQRHRILDFYPLERRWERSDTHESGPLPTDEPLDEVSFIYFVRTLPLEIGKTYRFDRYFRADGNPVVLNVLRKERVETPAGTFDTIVVRPIIRTAGLFSQGGEAEICLSDDGRRIPVLLRSKVPVLGRLTLTLESYVAGEPPLNPGASSAEAPASR